LEAKTLALGLAAAYDLGVGIFGDGAKPELEGEYSAEELHERLILFRQSAVLFGLKDGELRALARTMVDAEARKGTPIQAQGRLNNYFLIVRSGRCRIVHQTAPGHGVTIAILNPGDCFGENAMLEGSASNTSVVTDTDCRFLAATRETLSEALHSGSEFWADLRKIQIQRQTLLESVQHNNIEVDSSTGKVITVFSPKGGAGKSVVAVNLAAELALGAPGDVVLFDLALPFNHDVVMAGLVPTSCLARLNRQGDPDEFEEAVLAAIVRHPCGLQILPSALRAADADLIDSELVKRTLEVLAANFRYVVVDTHSLLSEVVLSTFDASHQIVLLSGYELVAIKDLEEVLDLFNGVLRIAPARVIVTFNKRQEKPAISRSDIEHGIERAIDVELPFVGNALELASVRGEIPLVADRRSAFAKAIGELAKKVSLAPVSSIV
jgi:pilus assembly protein CpaE